VDARIAVWVATHRVAVLNDPFVWLGTIDRLGAIWVVLAVAVGIACHRGLRGTAGLALLTALTTFAADSMAFAVKDATSRTRPFEAHPQIQPLYVVHSSSLPAGHAATAFAGAVILSAAAPRFTPYFTVIAVLIGFSRVYVGVHYPTDVLAGAALGCAVGLLATVALRALWPRLRAWRRPARGARRNVRSTA
jgi:undecaprenyl-diphosphatase